MRSCFEGFDHNNSIQLCRVEWKMGGRFRRGKVWRSILGGMRAILPRAPSLSPLGPDNTTTSMTKTPVGATHSTWTWETSATTRQRHMHLQNIAMVFQVAQPPLFLRFPSEMFVLTA